MAVWLLIYKVFYSGKLEKYHLMSESEKSLIRLVEESEDELKVRSSEPSSDSVQNDQALKEDCKRQFLGHVIAATKGLGVYIDDNKN